MRDKTTSLRKKTVDGTQQPRPAALHHPSILAGYPKSMTAPAAQHHETHTTRANPTAPAARLLHARPPTATTQQTIATTSPTPIHRPVIPTAQKTPRRLGFRRRVRQGIEHPLPLLLRRPLQLLLLLLTARLLRRLVGLEPAPELVEATSARREGAEAFEETSEVVGVDTESLLSVVAVVRRLEVAAGRFRGLAWVEAKALTETKTSVMLVRRPDQAVQALLRLRGLEGPSRKRLHQHNRRLDPATIRQLPRTRAAPASLHPVNRSPNPAARPLHAALPPQLALETPPQARPTPPKRGRIQH